MLRFKPELPEDGTVLCLGAHCDDVEIGCGGTMVELQRRHRAHSCGCCSRARMSVSGRRARRPKHLMGPGATWWWFTNSVIATFHTALRRSRMRSRAPEVVKPDLIFTHYLTDRHQDHRVLSELTWNTFRSHAVLEYEIPKYDGDLAIRACSSRCRTRWSSAKIKTLWTASPRSAIITGSIRTCFGG